MTNRHARSRSPPVPTERVPKEQLPPFRPVILMVDMMPLKSLHEINEDRFKPLVSVIASHIDDEEMKRAFSYSKFIPPDRLDVVTVRDVTKKVCKRFFAHFNVKLIQEEVELHIDDAFGRRASASVDYPGGTARKATRMWEDSWWCGKRAHTARHVSSR